MITFLATLPMSVLAFLFAETIHKAFMNACLVTAAGLLGASLTRKTLSRLSNRLAGRQEFTNPRANTKKSMRQTSDNTDYLRVVLDELARMQVADDLLQRYHCFVAMVESCLSHALGPCSVSLWCPDKKNEFLVECVISSDKASSESSQNTLSATTIPRSPCLVPLKANEIKTALKTGRAYLADWLNPNMPATKPRISDTLKTDACIPLYRDYGSPLLLNVQCDYDKAKVESSSAVDFQSAVELVKLIWDQLQTANQRQWFIEHEPDSPVLRGDTFIQQSQSLADMAKRRDELFAIVVITIHGFRSTFAGHSRQWRDLTNIVGQSLSDSLKQGHRLFMLGKMADDVFALMLPNTDGFLARAVMKEIIGAIDKTLPQSHIAAALDMIAIEIRWAIADQSQYGKGVQDMLDEIYQQLFVHEDDGACQKHRVVLISDDCEVESCK